MPDTFHAKYERILHDSGPYEYSKRWIRKLKRYPDHLRLKGSVIPAIFFTVVLMAGYTYVIAVCYIRYGYTELALSNSVVPALSVVLGLLLAFRANTSYARYYEGRQLWQDLSSNTRNLARLIWCSIPERTQNDHLEKMRCMKLLLAFAVSTKHYLRRELGIDYYDLDYLLPPNWVPAAADDDNQDTDSSVTLDHHQQQQQQQQATSSSASSSASIKDNSKSNLLDTSSGDHPDDLGHNKNQDANSVNNQKGKTTYNTFKFVSDEDLPDEGAADMSLPLEIIFRMSLYMEQAKKSGKIDGTFSNVIITHLNNLNDCLAGMERIVNTPIPAVYVVHLKQSLALYLLAIPFTLVSELRWWIVPTMILASFTLFGIDAIGAQIENPFGYNSNDLPLNIFCDSLRKEIEFVVYHLPCEVENAMMVS